MKSASHKLCLQFSKSMDHIIIISVLQIGKLSLREFNGFRVVLSKEMKPNFKASQTSFKLHTINHQAERLFRNGEHAGTKRGKRAKHFARENLRHNESLQLQNIQYVFFGEKSRCLLQFRCCSHCFCILTHQSLKHHQEVELLSFLL